MFIAQCHAVFPVPPSVLGCLQFPPKPGRWDHPLDSLLRPAPAKLLWICCRPVILVTTLSNMP